jgi:hypothetical protein
MMKRFGPKQELECSEEYRTVATVCKVLQQGVGWAVVAAVVEVAAAGTVAMGFVNCVVVIHAT